MARRDYVDRSTLSADHQRVVTAQGTVKACPPPALAKTALTLRCGLRARTAYSCRADGQVMCVRSVGRPQGTPDGTGCTLGGGKPPWQMRRTFQQSSAWAAATQPTAPVASSRHIQDQSLQELDLAHRADASASDHACRRLGWLVATSRCLGAIWLVLSLGEQREVQVGNAAVS